MKAKGVGLSYRKSFYKDIDFLKEEVDFLEMVPELLNDTKEISSLSDNFPVFPHSLSLSVGTEGPFPEKKIDRYKNFLEITGADLVSDHICLSEAGETELLDFVPVPFTNEMVEVIHSKAQEIKDKLGKPLVLENITYLLEWPENEMSEIDFLKKILEHENIYLLFDVTNLYINAINLSYSSTEFIEKLPAEKIRYLHISGCHESKGVLVDSHSQPINPEVWELMSIIKGKFPIEGVILERDLNYESYNDIRLDIQKLKEWYYN